MKVFRFAGLRSRSPRRVYFGWWVSVAGAFNMVFSAGPTFQATSVLFKAIEDEFGWSRTLISGGGDVWTGWGRRCWGRWRVGWWIRLGQGRWCLIGFTLGGAGLIFFSQINGPVQCYLAFLLLSLGFSSGGFVPSLTAANAWMIRRRALGMSIVEGGVSVGGLMVPLVVWGIGEFGWRPTVLVMGIVAILVGPMIAWVVGKRPTADQLATQVVPAGESSRRRGSGIVA